MVSCVFCSLKQMGVPTMMFNSGFRLLFLTFTSQWMHSARTALLPLNWLQSGCSHQLPVVYTWGLLNWQGCGGRQREEEEDETELEVVQLVS